MRGLIVASAGLGLALLAAQAVLADELRMSTVKSTTTPSPASYVKHNEWGGNEHYAYRLGQMKLQLNNGIRDGCLTGDAATRLNDRYAQLASLESKVRADGFPKAESDDLEKQLNMFNVDVSHALGGGAKTAGSGQVQ